MSDDLAKTTRARRRKDELTPRGRPVSTRTPFDDAHAALGNAAMIARARAATDPHPLAHADPLLLQSEFGNSAVERAARAGEFATPGFATNSTAYNTSASPLLTSPSAAATETGALASPPAHDAATAYDTAAPVSLFQPAPETTASEEEVETTIVFEEEEIIAGETEVEEDEEKETEEEVEEVEEASDKAREVAEFKEETATEEATRAAQEAKPAEDDLAAGTKKEEETAAPEEIVEQVEAGAEQPTEEEIGKAEAAAGEELIEAGTEKAEEGEGAAPAPEASGGDASELAGWKAKVSGATASIKQPDMSGASKAGERVRAAGGAAKGKAASAREGVGKEAEAVVPLPPKPPDPLPIPSEDPVPEASKLVRDASDKRLANQTLPKLVPTPRGNVPAVPNALPSEHATKVTTESAIAAGAAQKEAAGGAAQGEKDPEKERVEKMRGAQGEKADAEGRRGEGEPLVLVDEGPPPPPTITKTAQTDVGKVLAVLVSDPQSVAKEIVDDARRAAYPDETLGFPTFDDLGQAVLPEIETSVAGQLDAVREQAGISKEDLDKHVAERKQKLADEAAQASLDLGAAGEAETASLQEEGQETSNAIAGARDAVDEKTERQVEAASGDTDPVVIKSKRERLVRGVARKVAQQSLGYTQAGTRREKSLDDMGAAIVGAYTLAARKDEAQLLATAKAAGKSDVDAAKEAEQQSAPSFTWLKDRHAEVRRQVGELKTAAKTESAKLDTAVKDAGTTATELIRSWAEAQLSERQSFWEWLIDLFSDWSVTAHEEAAVWEEARNAETTASVVSDLKALDMVKGLEAQGIDGSQLQYAGNLTEEQRAVVKAYYEGGKDSIAAVAAGLRTRLSTQRRPELIKNFEAQLMALPDSRRDDVDLVAQAERPGRTAFEIASDVHSALDKWNDDEAAVFSALDGLTPLKLAAVRMCYRAEGWGNIEDDIASELGGDEETRAAALLKGDQSLADAAALREAISGVGTDEK
ncbi:MAG TPA: hypothetical protein VGB05_00185, partial [Pyrinomonadaceae bacterium]